MTDDPTTRPAARTAEEYSRALDRAGLGPADRARYIHQAPQDPACAARTWDEQVIPAAAADGRIPRPPVDRDVDQDLDVDL